LIVKWDATEMPETTLEGIIPHSRCGNHEEISVFALADSQPTVLFLSPMLLGNSCTQVAHWVIPQMQFSRRTGNVLSHFPQGRLSVLIERVNDFGYAIIRTSFP
jgi:hypothetical protein